MPIGAHEQNRLSWNAVTERHNSHKGDQAAFFRDGGSTIYPEEIGLLGDVRGTSLLHLQCNCGQDTLSIASSLGADVTGVDISDDAIDFAKALSSDSGIAASFDRADIFDWCEQQSAAEFDVVFTSYGVTGWLSDLNRWGRCIAQVLKPGGRFVIIEFHPAFFVTDENDPSRVKYDYMGGSVIEEAGGVSDYVGASGDSFKLGNTVSPDLPPFVNPHPAVSFAWGLGEIFNALAGAGLNIESFAEYPFSNGWQPYPGMRDLPGGRKAAPLGKPALPLMYSMTATKPVTPSS